MCISSLSAWLFLDCLIRSVKAPRFLETWGAACPLRQRRIPEDLTIPYLFTIHVCRWKTSAVTKQKKKTHFLGR